MGESIRTWPETLRFIGDHLDGGDDEDRELYHRMADYVTTLEAAARALGTILPQPIRYRFRKAERAEDRMSMLDRLEQRVDRFGDRSYVVEGAEARALIAAARALGTLAPKPVKYDNGTLCCRVCFHPWDNHTETCPVPAALAALREVNGHASR